MSWQLNATTQKLPGHAYKMCPSITTGINGSDDYTKNPTVAVQIDYNDSISPPWAGANNTAANLVCFSANTTCNPTNFDVNCSVPAAWSKVTYMTCNATLPSDGMWYACARSSDRAMPDRKEWGNANSNEANVSDTACGWITLDRVGPSVTVSTPSETVKVGDLVTFNAQASDSVSGVAGNFSWNWRDNAGAGSGTSAAHTFTQAGTYQVAATATDGAGNAGTGTKTITVQPAGSTGGDGTGTPSGGGTGGGTPTTGGGTSTPTTSGGGTTVIKEIVKEVQGPTQQSSIGTLDVLTAKTARISGKLKAIPLALTAETPGKVSLALVKGAKIVAKGAKTITGAGTFAYKLKLAKASKLKPGTYQLMVAFTAQGAAKASTKTLKIKLVKAKAGKASVATVKTVATTKRK